NPFNNLNSPFYGLDKAIDKLIGAALELDPEARAWQNYRHVNEPTIRFEEPNEKTLAAEYGDTIGTIVTDGKGGFKVHIFEENLQRLHRGKPKEFIAIVREATRIHEQSHVVDYCNI